jgi:hypothetical protein
MRMLGIYREKECSPGRHQSNDALLLEAVADGLRRRHIAVELRTIDDARHDGAPIFSMCQGRRALQRLLEWEASGASIVNSPRAALNTYRDQLPALMASAGVPFPETELVSTNGHGHVARPLDGRDHENGCWLKRGDVHASVSRDVQWVDSLDALEAGRDEFRSRGIEVAAIQAHRAGDEIKFYGVAGGAFFYWFYSGSVRRFEFDRDALTRLATRAAEAAGLEIFGGDIIVSPSGELTLIDLNDWPSFAPCRDAAADAIAEYLARRVHAGWNGDLVRTANESAL